MKGFIKWFDDTKGYGFIESYLDEDIYFHYSKIIADGYKTVFKNEVVSFDVVNTKNGKTAVNIKIID